MRSDLLKDRPKIYTEPGSPIAPVFSKVTDKNGKVELKITGEKNIYEEIQSHAESVDIGTIMQRYEREQDPAILQQKKGIYIDTTEMPKTFAEVQGIIIAETNRFNQLPLDIRKEFNYSVEEYVASIGTEKYENLINPKNEPAPINEPKGEPVNE